MNKEIKNNKKRVYQQGFTLIEILVVIGMIALLAAIVLIAINPAKQFAQGRNTQRQSNIETILNGIGQRMADNKGEFGGEFEVGGKDYHCSDMPTASTTSEIDIKFGTTSGQGDLGCLVPTYISSALKDPSAPDSSSDSGYEFGVDEAGRITVCAPLAEDEKAIPNAEKICVTR